MCMHIYVFVFEFENVEDQRIENIVRGFLGNSIILTFRPIYA